MPISYSISNTTNYAPVGIGTINSDTQFPAIYGNANFGYTVTFTTTDVGRQITNVTVLSSPVYTNEAVLSVNSVRITRDVNQTIYPNEYYNFAEFDSNFSKSIVTLQPAEANQASLNGSVFKWDMPPQKVVTGSYSFRISSINTTIVPNVTTNVTQTYTQELVWSLIPGTQALLELVSRSKF